MSDKKLYEIEIWDPKVHSASKGMTLYVVASHITTALIWAAKFTESADFPADLDTCRFTINFLGVAPEEA